MKINRSSQRLAAGVLMLVGLSVWAAGQITPVRLIDHPVDKWVTATGRAAGVDAKARDDAVAQALRTAVEQACGVFLTSQSKSEDYKAVYDKVFADAVGYVREHKVLAVTTADGVTIAKVRARVSTRKFESNWASIRHTVNQENNPRVIVIITEPGRQTAGIVQGYVEDFFISKGITLMDRTIATKVSKRDVLLAAIKNDTIELAALGARFKADVVVTGQASAKFGKELRIAGQSLYQYTATLNVRIIQTDSARVLVSKSFGPVTLNTLQHGGGDDKALAKLGKDYAPKLLSAVVEAWRKRANVSRTIQLSISGMDFTGWKTFKAEVAKIRGIQALRLREITEAVTNIDAEYRYTNESLADKLTELKGVKLKVLEISANRIKFKVVKPAAAE